MKILLIRWQRLTDAHGGTCPRCSNTGDAVVECVERLRLSLRPLGIDVQDERRELTAAEFSTNPLASNRIWIGGKSIEDWLGASVGQSACCDQCGDAECRTLGIDGVHHESVPAHLILRAGLLAAAELLTENTSNNSGATI